MNVRRRCAVGLVALSVMLTAGFTNAQALKQLPAKPLVIVKVNQPQAVSQRLGGIAQRMGLAALAPAMADPLGALRQQMGIRQGLDLQRDIAMGIYPPAEGEDEPRLVVLVPVSDYKAFLGNFQNVRAEGAVNQFEYEGEEVFAANWGNYAALSPQKAMLAQKPAGVELPANAAKLVDQGDFVAWFDAAQGGGMLLPMLRQQRPQIVAEMERELKGNAGFNQKFLPAMRSLVNRALDVAEGALESAQWQTASLTFGERGISMNTVSDFRPNSYAANLVRDYRGTDQPLLAGLPERRYFAFGGMTLDSKTLVRAFDDFANPVIKDLKAAGADAEPILTIVNAARANLAATESAAMGYAQPTGQIGQQAVMQQVAIYRGDVKKIAEAQRQSLESARQLMQLMPQGAEVQVNLEVKPKAVTIDGVALDSFRMEMKFDQNDPDAAQAAQMMQMLYGPDGMSGLMGAVDDKSYVMVAGGTDELLKAVVAAARKGDAPLAQQAGVQAVAGQFPRQRVAVYYVALDNILNTAMEYARTFGVPVNLKLPPNLPPIGMSLSTQENTVRGDAFISMDLIDGLVGAVMRMMMDQGGGAAPGAL